MDKSANCDLRHFPIPIYCGAEFAPQLKNLRSWLHTRECAKSSPKDSLASQYHGVMKSWRCFLKQAVKRSQLFAWCLRKRYGSRLPEPNEGHFLNRKRCDISFEKKHFLSVQIQPNQKLLNYLWATLFWTWNLQKEGWHVCIIKLYHKFW